MSDGGAPTDSEDAPDPASAARDAETARRWDEARERAEELLLGGPRTHRRGEIQERTGVPLERASRLWSALGFPSTPDDVPSFTESDLDALSLTGRLLEDETFDEAEELAVARTLGQTMARLAEWQANLLRRTIADSGGSADPETVVDAVERLVPVFEQLQSYAWRRHLAVTAERLLSGPAHPPGAGAEGTDAADTTGENVLVVGFADIVGFTTLSRRVADTELRSLLERFEAVSTDVVARRGGRIVKTLGDEILFVCHDVTAAMALAFDLHDEIPDDDGRLTLRIGMARGEVLPRYGDVYGPVVNIASRLTSHAHPGAVLVDEQLTDAVRAAGLDYELRSVRQLSVRGYRHLRPHVARRAP